MLTPTQLVQTRKHLEEKQICSIHTKLVKLNVLMDFQLQIAVKMARKIVAAMMHPMTRMMHPMIQMMHPMIHRMTPTPMIFD